MQTQRLAEVQNLVEGVYSNTERSGRILELYRGLLGPHITDVCCNRSVHRTLQLYRLVYKCGPKMIFADGFFALDTRFSPERTPCAPDFPSPVQCKSTRGK